MWAHHNLCLCFVQLLNLVPLSAHHHRVQHLHKCRQTSCLKPAGTDGLQTHGQHQSKAVKDIPLLSRSHPAAATHGCTTTNTHSVSLANQWHSAWWSLFLSTCAPLHLRQSEAVMCVFVCVCDAPRLSATKGCAIAALPVTLNTCAHKCKHVHLDMSGTSNACRKACLQCR